MATFGELKRQILLRLDQPDGTALLAVEQAVNDVLQLIAKVKDFDELITLDTTNATTVADTKLYHLVNSFNLTRLKDIYSIRCMDGGSSRKLNYVSPRELDEVVPYTEQTGTGKPNWYTRRGMFIELYRIPDATYPLYIQYSQWPAKLTADTDEPEYINIDDVIVALSSDAVVSMLEGSGSGDWFQRAEMLLRGAVKEDDCRPDRTHIAKPYRAGRSKILGEYWADPFYKGR